MDLVSDILEKNTVGSKHPALVTEELDTVEVAGNILGVVVELEVLAAILRLEDNAGTTDGPYSLVVLPCNVDDTIAARVDLTGFKKSLDIDLIEVRVGASFLIDGERGGIEASI
jgi:hypothetical protein